MSATTAPTIVPGQELWFVASDRRSCARNGYVKVNAVGRKWITLGKQGQMRAHKDTLIVDGRGFSSPGRCYLTREEYETERANDAAWDSLRDFINTKWSRPEHLGADEIRKMLAVLAPEAPR
jgi:hypothetical protein